MGEEHDRRSTDKTILTMSNNIATLNAKFDNVIERLDTIVPIVEKVIRHDEKIDTLQRHSSQQYNDISRLKESELRRTTLQKNESTQHTTKTTTIMSVVTVMIASAVSIFCAWIDRQRGH